MSSFDASNNGLVRLAYVSGPDRVIFNERFTVVLRHDYMAGPSDRIWCSIARGLDIEGIDSRTDAGDGQFHFSGLWFAADPNTNIDFKLYVNDELRATYTYRIKVSHTH